MLSTVLGLYKAIFVIVLCSGIQGVRINRGDAENEKILDNNVKINIHEPLKTLNSKENDVGIIPADMTHVSFVTDDTKLNQNEDLPDDVIGVILGEAVDDVIQRKKRQASHAYSQLYPQLPSGPPYNPYQQQPNSNPYGQTPYQPQPTNNPYQHQPSYNPSGQNTNQQQPTFNPYSPNPNQHQPNYNHSGQSPYTPRHQQWNSNNHNSSQPGYPANNYNPNTGFHFPNQSPYNLSSSSGNSYRPPNGQHPLQNQTFNYPPHTGSYRPPNGSSYTTPWPSYNAQTGTNFRNTSYPGQPPYNSNYPPTFGNKYPFQQLNSTSQRPPYFNPNQYPSYNNSHTNPSQWPSSTNSQYPNFPGVRPSPGYNPYVHQGSHNTTLSHGSPYYPGSNGQYPSNNNFNTNYPTPNSSHAYNPSIPNYPAQNNQTQAYDPRRVPPQHFSYH